MGMSGWSSDVRSSDLTQRRVVSDAQLDDFLRAAELIFEPFPPSSVTVGIAGVRFNPDSGDAEVTWTKSKNGGSVPAALTVAEGLGEKGEGVVVVRVTYNYQPVFFYFILSATEIEQTAVLRPMITQFVQGHDRQLVVRDQSVSVR